MLTDEQIKERNKRFNKRNKNLKVAFIGLGFSILCYILWFLIVIITVLLGSFHVKIPQTFFDDLAMWLPVYLASVGASITGLAIIKNIFDFIFSKDPTKFWKMDKQNTYVDLEFQKRTEEKYERMVKEDIQKSWDSGMYLYDIYLDLCKHYKVPDISYIYSESSVIDEQIDCFSEEIIYDTKYKEKIWREKRNLPPLLNDNYLPFILCLPDPSTYFQDEDIYDNSGNASPSKIKQHFYGEFHNFINDYNITDNKLKEYNNINKIPLDELLKFSASNRQLLNYLISELTEKELAENRICYSPFREESEWQQREKDNQEIIEYKEKYPWKNKYRKF